MWCSIQHRLSGVSGYVYRIEYNYSNAWLPLLDRAVTTRTEHINVAFITNATNQRIFRGVLLP